MNVYLVQTVSSRPRPWSSYTNINSKDCASPPRMNSAEELSKYHDHNSHYCSPVLARRTGGTSYDIPEKSPKKDKKWSLGSLFRRKKKPGSESSSDEEVESKSFLQKKKKKVDKRKRTNKTVGFDHVVVPPSSRQVTNGYKNDDSLGVLSEPSFTGRTVPRNFIPASDFTCRLVPLKDSQENLDRNGINRSSNSLGSPSVSSLGRRKKEVVKARAEARRDTSKGDYSSDEDSQKSAFKSDDSLTKHRDGSVSRRSRAARTQRYLKRRSKDDEGQDPPRNCKSDIEHNSRSVQHLKIPDDRMQNMKSASKSPILSATPKSKLSYTNSAPSSRPNFSGLSTIPPSHTSQGKYRTINITNGSLYKQSSSFHDYNDTGNKPVSENLTNQRSLSCGANIHNAAPSPENADEVVHVQFQLGRPFNKRSNMVINQHLTSGKRQPPPPPPRDPRRILTVQNAEGRPISYSFENGYQSKNAPDQQSTKPPATSINLNYNLNPSCRSTSEDHISLEPSQRIPLVPRPSSATPEANRLQKLGRNYSENGEGPNNFRYLADKNPRSRKPICIQSLNQVEDTSDKVDQHNNSKKPFDFWKQKDEETARSNSKKSAPSSPLMFTAQTHVKTNIFLPNGVKVEADPSTLNGFQRESSPFRPITSPKPPSPNSDKVEKICNGSLDETDLIKRKSSNLEDALDELEAIYNSLHLGDEDLLERAEQREAAAAQKRRDAAFESFPNSVARGTLSDSSFGYDPNFDSKKKRYVRRTEPDRKADDMAFRKLNKERYNTISDPQSSAPRASYLLTSPVFSTPVDDSAPQKDKSKNREPDVTFDDVVYRNVKHTNNSLKVSEPQPPFGIPIGPILPASNSDYLHATPEASQKLTFKPRKIPDIVKDDLAYRNLRKDSNKEPALPQTTFNHEDYLNNNNKSGETLKKKRAVRSLSANIFNLMQRDWKPNIIAVEDVCDSKQQNQNIGDVADALEIARQILKEKEQKISATRKAFMSDGELKYRKFGSSSPTEQRINFLNEMRSSNSVDNENVYHHKLQVSIPVMDYERLEAKPPTPDRSRRSSRPSTKESTPIPSSPSEEAHIKKQLQQPTLDELLSSLAVQARETSDRITNELKMYEDERGRNQFENGICFKSSSPELQIRPSLKDSDSNEIERSDEGMTVIDSLSYKQSSPEHQKKSIEKLKELEKDAISASLNLQLTDTDSTSEHAKLCEKLLECVVDSTELSAATKDESEPLEEVAKIHSESPLVETVANIVLTPSDKCNLELDPVSVEVFSESDHDYVNIQSNDEIEKDVEIGSETAKDAPQTIEMEGLSLQIQEDSVAEIGSSTEMDDEEKELLIDDDTVSADICMSPLEKHKAELIAAFEELRLKDAAERKTKKGGKKERNLSEDVKNFEQTDKGGGEECVSVQYIALPTKGCALTSESHFNFNSFNQVEAERYLNVYSFGFDSGKETCSVTKFEKENCNHANTVEFADVQSSLKNSSSENWIYAEDALDSLKSPKLVKNINTAVTENYKLFNDCNLNLNDNEGASSSNIFDSQKIVLGLETCLKELENNSPLDNNLPARIFDLEKNCSNIDKKFDSQTEVNVDTMLANQLKQNVELYPMDIENNLVGQLESDGGRNHNVESQSQCVKHMKACLESVEKRDSDTNCKTQSGKEFGEAREEISAKLDKDSCVINDSSGNDNVSSNQVNRSLYNRTCGNSELTNQKFVNSDMRDSRHTRGEIMRPSRPWYEDPAVFALACSCGIACTSQISSFDIIIVLGLLFAIISLLIALITRT